MWGLRFAAASAAALIVAGCAGQPGPKTTVSQAPTPDSRTLSAQTTQIDAPRPRATRDADAEAAAPTAAGPSSAPTAGPSRAAAPGALAAEDPIIHTWGPRAIHIGDYDAYVSTAEAAALDPTPPPVHLGDYDQRQAEIAAPTPPPVHLGDYDRRQAWADAPTPSPAHLGDDERRQAQAAAPTPPPVHLGDYDQRQARAAAPTPPPVHLGDYDQRQARAATPTPPPVHLGDYDRRQARAAAPTPPPVHLGDYDQRRAAARFGPPRPGAPAPPRPQLRRAAPESIAARAIAAPRVQAAATAVKRLMSPVYDDGDFAPQTPGPSAGELSAPPPKGRASTTNRARYDSRVADRLAAAAMERTRHRVRYDGRYVQLAYPWGDVPGDIGVCTDVIVRAYRGVGVDLQSLLHEDIRSAFSDYPSRRVYGKSRPDRNIDHRRVVNLERFLERQGASLPVSYDPDSFQPGDVVSWRLNGSQPHIGVVVEERDPATGFPLVVHNIGSGPKADNILALQEPVGHYRYTPRERTRVAMR